MSGKPPGNVDALDRQVRALAHPVRRTVVRQVAANPTRTTLDGLGKTVAASRVGEVDEETLRELRIALHHVHLPKLDDAGLVTYDAESGQIDSTVHQSEGKRIWRAVTAIDGVVTLLENGGTVRSARLDTELSAD